MKFNSIPVDLMVRLRDKHGLRQFVETGTGFGDSAVKAACFFDLVTTCEIDKERVVGLLSSLPKLGPPKELRLLRMDSPAMLRMVFSNRECVPAMVWLDAHWSGGLKLGPECPLMCELEAIARHSPIKDRCVVLIDDARLFLNPPPVPHDPDEWPTFAEITELVETEFPNHTMAVEGDVIVIEPAEGRVLV